MGHILYGIMGGYDLYYSLAIAPENNGSRGVLQDEKNFDLIKRKIIDGKSDLSKRLDKKQKEFNNILDTILEKYKSEMIPTEDLKEFEQSLDEATEKIMILLKQGKISVADCEYLDEPYSFDTSDRDAKKEIEKIFDKFNYSPIALGHVKDRVDLKIREDEIENIAREIGESVAFSSDRKKTEKLLQEAEDETEDAEDKFQIFMDTVKQNSKLGQKIEKLLPYITDKSNFLWLIRRQIMSVDDRYTS